MSWRELLGVAEFREKNPARNTQNTQKISSNLKSVNSANNADIANKESKSSEAVGLLLTQAADRYGVTVDWIRQFVLDPFDIKCLKKGELTLSCLDAHIEYHLKEQGQWRGGNTKGGVDSNV